MGMMKPQKVGVEAMEDRVERLAHPEGFSPAGLKVLVVDDDLLCLMILERMLAQCKYTVTTCNSATKALAMLRENRSYFDLVLSDVYMPDMDGFKLLEAIGLELDLPVIMMSGDGETDVVMKGITHGACDYLLKPVRLEELRNIWQHVVRKRVTPRDTPKEELSGEWDESAKPLESDPTEYEQTSSRKRKEKMEDDYQVVEDMNNLKKARVVWSVELHQQFVNAVHQLGVDRAVPRRILDIMNVQGLTRENVASHLQKYRLYLKRLIGVTPQPYPVASFQASEGGKFGGIMQIQPGGRPAASSSNKGVNLRANPAMPLTGLGGGGGGQIDSTTLNTLVQLQSLQQKQQAGNGQGGLLANPLHVATTQAQGTPPMVSLGLQRMDSSELDRLMKAQYDAGRQRGERGAANNLAVLLKNNEDLSLFKSLGGQDETKPMLGNHNNNAGSNMMTAMSMSSLRMGEELGGNNAGGLGYIETAQCYNHNKVGSGDFSSSLPFSMGTSLSNGGVSDGSFSSYNDFPGGPEFLSASTPDLSLLGQLEALEQGEGKYHLPAHSSTYPS